MRNHRNRGLAAMALLLAAGTLGPPALAAPRQNDDRMRRQEEIQETVEIYMITKMRRALELTDEQSRVVIPVVEALNSARREFGRQRRQILRHLMPLVQEDDPDEEEIADLLGRLERLDGDFRRAEEDAREALRGTLTPLQQAKFMFFQERFHREMQDRIRRLQEEGRRPGPRPGGMRRPRP